MPIVYPAKDETLRAAQQYAKSDLHRRVVSFLRDNPYSYRDEIAAGIQVKPPTVTKQLQDLTEMGVIGSDREGKRFRRYFVQKDRLVELMVVLMVENVDELDDVIQRLTEAAAISPGRETPSS